MQPTLQLTWQRKIDFIKADYPKLHLFYSTHEGWAYVSWKGKRVRIDSSMTIDAIREKVYWIIV